MYADPGAAGGVLEPEGIVEIKYRTPDLFATMHRLDPLILQLKVLLLLLTQFMMLLQVLPLPVAAFANNVCCTLSFALLGLQVALLGWLLPCQHCHTQSRMRPQHVIFCKSVLLLFMWKLTQ